MNKRGQGEQFNWLFVIIAGAIILSFFIVFTFKYIALQEKRQDAALARTFGENIHLLEASGIESYFIDDSSFKLGVTTKLDFICEEDTSTIVVNNNFGQDIKNEVVFAPTSLTTSSIDAWIYSWDYPYYIANIIYLSDPGRAYYLIHDVRSKEFVEDLEIPEIFNVYKQDKRIPIDSRKEDQATVIYFTSVDSQDIRELEEEFENVNVLSVDLQQEKIIFYDERGTEEGTAPYYGPAVLFGAFFSTSFEDYQCSLTRALKRFERVTELYKTKSLVLQQEAEAQCNYQSIQQTFNNYGRNFENNDKTLRESLVNQNEDLGGKGCAVVF